jgi:hypothetical protein
VKAYRASGPLGISIRVHGVGTRPVVDDGDLECEDDEQQARAVAAAMTTQIMTDVLRSVRGSLTHAAKCDGRAGPGAKNS